jgi:hypothetical protein
MIARIFAETGIKSLFLHIHELIRKHQNKEEVVKLRGTWVPVNPAGWRDRLNVTVNIGLGIGSRESNLLHLNSIREIQGMLSSAGYSNLIVKPKNVYNMAKEIAKNAGQEPDLFFTDPGDKMAPPSSQEQMEIQQQMQLIQQKEAELRERENRVNRTELQHQREMLKIQQDKIEHTDDVMVELEKLRNQLTEMQLKYDEPVRGASV